LNRVRFFSREQIGKYLINKRYRMGKDITSIYDILGDMSEQDIVNLI